MITNIYTRTDGEYITLVYKNRYRFEHFRLYEPVRLALQRLFFRELRPVRVDLDMLDWEVWTREADAKAGIVAEIVRRRGDYLLRTFRQPRLFPLTPVEVKSILFACEYAVQL